MKPGELFVRMCSPVPWLIGSEYYSGWFYLYLGDNEWGNPRFLVPRGVVCVGKRWAKQNLTRAK